MVPGQTGGRPRLPCLGGPPQVPLLQRCSSFTVRHLTGFLYTLRGIIAHLAPIDQRQHKSARISRVPRRLLLLYN